MSSFRSRVGSLQRFHEKQNQRFGRCGQRHLSSVRRRDEEAKKNRTRRAFSDRDFPVKKGLVFGYNAHFFSEKQAF